MADKKKKISKKEKKVVSMKEAFDKAQADFKTISVNKSERKRLSFRDWLWNYPDNVDSFIKNTSPLSYILLFLLLGIVTFSFLRSDSFADMFDDARSEVYVEGSVGQISTFNPIFLTQNQVDKDIQALVFEKFINIDTHGEVGKGIATSWAVSKDGKIYDFTIDTSHKWQDGESLTVDDIIFTFEVAKSLAGEYSMDTVGSVMQEVEIVKITDDKVRFVLSETNSTFFEAVSVYIIPEHILGDVSLGDFYYNSFARYPIGSGPYKVYRSEPNVVYLSASDYFRVNPKIETFIYRLYPDYDSMEAAFRNGVLDAVGGIDGGSMEFADEYSGYNAYEMTVYSRIRMLFFNLRKEKLESDSVRVALNYITDKDALLEKANISGEPEYGPIYEGSWAYGEDVVKYGYEPGKAVELFKSAGYTKSEDSGYYESEDGKILSFTLSYYDSELNNRLVNALKDLWKDEGVVLNLEPRTYTQLSQETIATRDYEILLYEIETTVDPDQYNLWHSLRIEYPALNLSGYSYERVDILLEEARKTLDKDVRKEKYNLFQKYLTQDAPVLFLYHPNYYHVVSDDVQTTELGALSYPYQRFEDIASWAL